MTLAIFNNSLADEFNPVTINSQSEPVGAFKNQIEGGPLRGGEVE